MRLMLMGSRPFYAPETEDGAEFDDADADDLETPEAAEDDEPLDDAEPDADEDPDLDAGAEEPELEERPTRGATRFQTLAAERAAERARADALERELADLRSQRQQQSQAEAQRAEQERLALMDPAERLEHQMNQRLARIEFQSWDANDRVAFESVAASNPAVARLKAEVEATFQAQVTAGKPIDRQTIAAFLIGQKALAAAPRARAAGKRAAEAGKERNTARPASGRGDVPAARNRSADPAAARRARLADLEI
jgi:hypothetical protein